MKAFVLALLLAIGTANAAPTCEDVARPLLTHVYNLKEQGFPFALTEHIIRTNPKLSDIGRWFLVQANNDLWIADELAYVLAPTRFIETELKRCHEPMKKLPLLEPGDWEIGPTNI